MLKRPESRQITVSATVAPPCKTGAPPCEKNAKKLRNAIFAAFFPCNPPRGVLYCTRKLHSACTAREGGYCGAPGSADVYAEESTPTTAAERQVVRVAIETGGHPRHRWGSTPHPGLPSPLRASAHIAGSNPAVRRLAAYRLWIGCPSGQQTADLALCVNPFSESNTWPAAPKQHRLELTLLRALLV